MLTSIRGLVAASIVAGSIAVATPAFAQDAESDITISGNAAITSDYRFRGISLSNGNPAIQGGIDVSHSSGFYIGTWGSSLTSGTYGAMELDVYGGWSGEITSGVSADVGVLYYAYPDGLAGADLDYIELYASLGFTVGPAEATVGVAYAPDQDSLGSDDNLYIYTDLGVGIPDTPLSISAHLGYTSGVLAPPLLGGANDDSGLDWSIGADFALSENLSIGVMYTGVEGPSVNDFTDDAIVATLSVSF
ncbi:MAG: TorF family putative porin [Novosphingobium sp.]|nr:TorF family putative porin [Novosphingobium sp.]